MQRKTKLVCTIGPASESKQVIERLMRAGMNVARINLSHGTLEEHGETIAQIREMSSQLDMRVAIILDMPGRKMRTGPVERGDVYLEDGSDFSLVSEAVAGNEQRVSVSFPQFFIDMNVNDPIFLNDGIIQLKVTSANNRELKCKVVSGGLLTANRGINIPGVKLNIPSITVSDLKQMEYGIELGVDFFAISFVRSAADISDRKLFLQEKGAEIPIIAKIEKHEAVKDFDAILAEADGVMVARGDLGIEIPLEKVPTVQKEIIRKCNRAGKPVIVATQMLESMINSVRPTRAEVSDVANAIFDGADAVMLSGETAVGKYPVQTVRTMAKIVAETESALQYSNMLIDKSRQVTAHTDDAISFAACSISHQLNASCIVAYTASGSTALRVSRCRPKAPILALTPHASVARRLILSWGVEPYVTNEPSNIDVMFNNAAQLASKTGIAKTGDRVVITAGIPMGKQGSTNVVKVQPVE